MRPVHGSLACVPLLVALSVSAAAQETTPPESTTVTVTGRVADPLDSHIAGAGVIVRPRDQLLTIDALKDPDVKSDAEGRFELQLEVTDDATTRPILHVAARGKAAVWVTLRPKKKDGGGYESTLDLGDIVLLDGTRFFGRVRDADGKPLAGVRVTASDMLASSQVLRTSTRHAAHSTALTGENGIFSLPSVLPQALKVDFVAPGHYHRTLQPVSRHTPLEVRLEKSGFISGRVLDERGSPVATAVTATYEVAGSQSPVQSGEDGSFRLTLAHPARYLIRATAPRDTKLSNRQTDVLAGTQENLEIVLEGQKAQAGEAGNLVVKAVDKATGEPIAEFLASVGWDEQGKNDNYLAYYIFSRDWKGTASEGGAVKLSGPAPEQPQVGWVHVQAPGFAPTTVDEVEWDEDTKAEPAEAAAGEGEKSVVEAVAEPGTVALSKTIVVELGMESRLSGMVRDDESGQPIAGAKIWAVPQQDRMQGYYGGIDSSPPTKRAVTSGDDGTFDLGELAEGGWELFAHHTDRPRYKTPVSLKAAEHRQGFELLMPPGALVKGRLKGAKIGRGWQVQLFKLPKIGPQGIYNWNQDSKTKPVAGDGSFEFTGVQLNSYMLSVLIPVLRGGQPLHLPIEPFRVRAEGVDREFDLGADLLGSVAGKVKLTGASVPMDRLVVVASELQEDNPNVFFGPFNVNYQGPRAFVEPDGSFSLQLPPGRHELQLVDVATGIRLGASEPFRIRSGTGVETELAADVVEVRVRLQKEAEDVERIVADRLEIRVTPKQPAGGGARGVMFGGNDNYDTGVGLPLEVGQTELLVVVPPSQISFFVRSNAWRILPSERRNEARVPLGRLDYDTEDNRGEDAVIPVAGPPVVEEIAGDGGAEQKAGREGR